MVVVEGNDARVEELGGEAGGITGRRHGGWQGGILTDMHLATCDRDHAKVGSL